LCCVSGIEEKLTYIRENVNASTIMLNSFFESDDFGVTDYQAIESTIGTMEAFTSLRFSAHKRGK
jgi:glycosidase